ncbi:MAG: right-handed parallel beta-helix repeat-containing protein [Puniceicoccaceae bacterium]
MNYIFPIHILKKSLVVIILCFCLSVLLNAARTFHVDSWTGNDEHDGLTPATAWKSLERASSESYKAGDHLLLCKGRLYQGTLKLTAIGTKKSPVIVSSYDAEIGADTLPVIDASGYLAPVEVLNGKHLIISNLELTADAGTPFEERALEERFGVLITADEPGKYHGFQLKNLNIHNIFATRNIEKDGQNPTSNMGLGIAIFMDHPKALIQDVWIEGCNIRRTGHTGIRIFGNRDREGSGENVYLKNVTILNNYLKEIGGPGMVPGIVENLLVKGNVTDDTGSSVDPRMHNRGSGIWPWTCNDVLIENNKFMHAFGKHDSHGAHIDFNCMNVVVQYNLSINNHGGFVEILGNNRNCSYRYNISINDGWRIEGTLGAKAEGNTLWTSGYTGSTNPRIGPFNSYIYNNTVYVRSNQLTNFSIVSNTDGIFVANNIFHILATVGDDSQLVKDPDTGEQTTPKRVVFENNIYLRDSTVPESLLIQDANPIVGDVRFSNPGGFKATDYIPANKELVKDKGIVPTKLPGDPIGLKIGLEVDKDIFGNPIKGAPDMGAIEIQ